jgi:hypothetical protein
MIGIELRASKGAEQSTGTGSRITLAGWTTPPLEGSEFDRKFVKVGDYIEEHKL